MAIRWTQNPTTGTMTGSLRIDTPSASVALPVFDHTLNEDGIPGVEKECRLCGREFVFHVNRFQPELCDACLAVAQGGDHDE